MKTLKFPFTPFSFQMLLSCQDLQNKFGHYYTILQLSKQHKKAMLYFKRFEERQAKTNTNDLPF